MKWERSWSWVAGICQLLPAEYGVPFALVAPFGQGTSFRFSNNQLPISSLVSVVLLSSAVGRHQDRKQARIPSALSVADRSKSLTSQVPGALCGENLRIRSTYTVVY